MNGEIFRLDGQQLTGVSQRGSSDLITIIDSFATIRLGDVRSGDTIKNHEWERNACFGWLWSLPLKTLRDG